MSRTLLLNIDGCKIYDVNRKKIALVHSDFQALASAMARAMTIQSEYSPDKTDVREYRNKLENSYTVIANHATREYQQYELEFHPNLLYALEINSKVADGVIIVSFNYERSNTHARYEFEFVHRLGPFKSRWVDLLVQNGAGEQVRDQFKFL